MNPVAQGAIALVGGSEHGPGCEAIDRALLASSGAARPVVAVLPFASSLRTRARTVGRAVEWWTAMGAVPLIAAPETGQRSDLVDHADVIVLTGGVPDRLSARLLGTPLWSQVVARWHAGAALSGSSSGAMLFGSHRQSVRAPLAVRSGAALLAGLAVAPHHQQWAPRALASWRTRTHPHLTILGIEDATALIALPDGDRGPTWRVLGAGGLAVRRGTSTRVYRSGDVVAPESLGLWTPPVPQRTIDVAELPAPERRPQVA
ncbi:Type 1 glutamine amidotransferase-like domain-containing protein [Nitriliruptor alkaliphilus]|uniref:Type 1 glutamine amidotransferase-like domain-containing protein n=1 Tax=Nitriliruptor alkaliphilus TaxID=427918 RepID=UPI00069629A2|nr:Type 1 glutamine amidotransferase-like domain-containing protein [Nitriliruptor alkaliphilus]